MQKLPAPCRRATFLWVGVWTRLEQGNELKTLFFKSFVNQRNTFWCIHHAKKSAH